LVRQGAAPVATEPRHGAAFRNPGTPRPLASQFSAALRLVDLRVGEKRREDADEVAERGLMGAKRRDGGTVQSWVKPEVDPPRVCARQRASYLGRVHRPRMTHFSAA